jgi:RNA polymerase sigma-70 factor (ECF subfamily)
VAGNVTELLARWTDGDKTAVSQLAPIVYAELRRIGRCHLRAHRGDSILAPTVLVNEAWLRLIGKSQLALSTRTHFFALAAGMMREILCDHVRKKNAAKRGGRHVTVSLDQVVAAESARYVDALLLEDALRRLSQVPRYARIVELRFSEV